MVAASTVAQPKVTVMGYVSYSEDNDERAYNSRMMLKAFEHRLRPKAVYVAVSPPLQPTIAVIVLPTSALTTLDVIATRTQVLRDKHVLALYELRPPSCRRH